MYINPKTMNIGNNVYASKSKSFNDIIVYDFEEVMNFDPHSSNLTTRFFSTYDSDDFFNIFVEFLNSQKKLLLNDKNINNAFYWALGNRKDIDEFIKDHVDNDKEYTIEDFCFLLAKLDPDYKDSDENTVKSIIKEKLTNGYVFSDFALYCRPYYWDVLDTPAELVYRHLRDRFSYDLNKNMLNTYVNVYNALLDEEVNDDDNLIDLNSDNFMNFCKNIDTLNAVTNNLKLTDPELLDFVKTLTVGEFKMVLKKMPQYANEEDMVFFGKSIIETYKNADFDLNILDTLHIYQEFMTKSNGELDCSAYIGFNKFLLVEAEYKNNIDATKLVIDYVKELNTITTSDFDKMNAIFFNFNVMEVVFDEIKIHYLYLLSSKVGVVKAVDIFYDLYIHKTDLCLQEWIKVLNNLDDFLKIPVSLWKDLL